MHYDRSTIASIMGDLHAIIAAEEKDGDEWGLGRAVALYTLAAFIDRRLAEVFDALTKLEQRIDLGDAAAPG